MIANTEGGAPRRASGHSAHRWASGPHLVRDRAAPSGPMAATRDWLIEAQHADGYWVGELEGDTILESEYVLLMAFLGRESTSPSASRRADTIREQQLPDGGWAIYPGGPADISASVKAYFALKLVGVPADDPAMVRAREVDPRDGRGARRATASRGSTSPCSARSATTSARASRPSWC